MWRKVYIWIAVCFCFIDCMHIISLDEDFNIVKSDTGVAKNVGEILKRLKTFKVPVHPRIHLFYMLLKKGLSDYAQKTADSLFQPNKYNIPVANTL